MTLTTKIPGRLLALEQSIVFVSVALSKVVAPIALFIESISLEGPKIEEVPVSAIARHPFLQNRAEIELENEILKNMYD